jgi:hypothetical protein
MGDRGRDRRRRGALASRLLSPAVSFGSSTQVGPGWKEAHRVLGSDAAPSSPRPRRVPTVLGVIALYGDGCDFFAAPVVNTAAWSLIPPDKHDASADQRPSSHGPRDARRGVRERRGARSPARGLGRDRMVAKDQRRCWTAGHRLLPRLSRLRHAVALSHGGVRVGWLLGPGTEPPRCHLQRRSRTLASLAANIFPQATEVDRRDVLRPWRRRAACNRSRSHRRSLSPRRRGTLHGLRVPVMYQGGTRDFGVTPALEKTPASSSPTRAAFRASWGVTRRQAVSRRHLARADRGSRG